MPVKFSLKIALVLTLCLKMGRLIPRDEFGFLNDGWLLIGSLNKWYALNFFQGEPKLFFIKTTAT